MYHSPEDTVDLFNCPLCENFKFYSECPIDECLYHTIRCETSCILLGMKVPDNSTYGTLSKQLSVAEILYYKGDYIPKATVRSLSSLKKEGLFRLKSVIVLHYYIEWLRLAEFEAIRELDAKYRYNKFRHDILNTLQRKYPFNVTHFGVTPALILNVSLQSNYTKFKEENRHRLPSVIELADLIEVGSDDLKQLRMLYKKLMDYPSPKLS